MKREDSLKLNNRGITLIEIMVVVVIIGIMATAATMAVGAVYGRNANRAATKLSKLLDSARIEAMNRVDGQVALRISVDSDGDYIATVVYKSGATETLGQSEVLGNSGLTVKIMKDNSGTEAEYITVSASQSFDFQFKKSLGSFKKGASSEPEIAGVVITSSSKKAEVVTVWETGRNYVIDVE